MFKKTAAIILSFALLAVSLWMVPTAGAASGATTLVQDFESFSGSGSQLVAYTLHTSNGTDGNAHSGTKSIYRSAANNTYGVAVFPEETTTSIVAGNTYELKFWIKIASTIPGTGTIQLMYSQAKDNANTTAKVAGSSTPNIAILKKPGEASTNVDASKVGEWQEIAYTFTATHTGYLALSGWGTNEYYLDDITLTEVAKTTVSFETNNALILSDIENYPGEALTLPTPTTKTGKVLEGWYTDEALTQKFESTVQPNEDITLYAKWVTEPKGWTQDFETWNTTLNNYNTTNSASKTGVTNTEIISVDQIDQTTGYAVHYNSTTENANGTRVIVNVASDKAKVKEFISDGDTLCIRFKYKVISGSAKLTNAIGINDITNPSAGSWDYLGGWNQTALSGVSDEWKTATKYYTIANSASANLVTLVFSIVGAAEIYIDDVEVYNANTPGIATDANGYGAIRAASTDKKQGVRGYHAIDKDWMANNDIVEYGLLAVRADRLNGAELNLSAVGTAVQAVVWNKTTKPTATLWDINQHEYVFTGVLTGINPEYYGSAYYVRTYAKDASGNVIYGEVAEYTVYEVVYAVLNATEPDATDYAAAEAVKNEDATAYEAWVATNKAS